MKKRLSSRIGFYLLMALAPLPVIAATGDSLMTTIMTWSGNGNSPEVRTATFIPWLIPIPLLKIPYSSWSPYEKQKVPQATYDQFWTMVQNEVANGPSGCADPTISLYNERTLAQATEPTTAVAVARSFPLVLIGTLSSEVPAWDFRLGKMASIAYIKVDEVIKNGQKRTVPAYVSISRDYGTAQIQGITLCSRGKELPTTGSPLRHATGDPQILLVGRLASGNSDYVETAHELIFRIDDGDLLYPSGVEAYPSISMSLLDFKAQIDD
jgi:hypothetical protein